MINNLKKKVENYLKDHFYTTIDMVGKKLAFNIVMHLENYTDLKIINKPKTEIENIIDESKFFPKELDKELENDDAPSILDGSYSELKSRIDNLRKQYGEDIKNKIKWIKEEHEKTRKRRNDPMRLGKRKLIDGPVVKEEQKIPEWEDLRYELIPSKLGLSKKDFHKITDLDKIKDPYQLGKIKITEKQAEFFGNDYSESEVNVPTRDFAIVGNANQNGDNFPLEDVYKTMMRK